MARGIKNGLESANGPETNMKVISIKAVDKVMESIDIPMEISLKANG